MSEISKDTGSSTKPTATRRSSRPLKILFLSSDTGGGHRASAESLANQFQLQFPGTTYDLIDVIEKDGVAPYNQLVSAYKHLSSHPSQWKLVYSVSNSRSYEMLANAHLKLMCERAIRRRIMSYDPDVVVSVHPLMTNVPVLSCAKISNETGRHLPMFTVVTDLGSAHSFWFANGVEKMFIGSDQIRKLAKERGNVPDEKLIMAGLPIRHDFALQSERLGDRMSPQGKAYQREVRQDLGLPKQLVERKTILVMGGGEGVGSLSNIVDALYMEFVSQGIDAVIYVVCGRNTKLKEKLDNRDWVEVFRRWQAAKEYHGGGITMSPSFGSLRDVCQGAPLSPTAGCIEGSTVTGTIRRMMSTGNLMGSAISTPFPETMTQDEKKVDEREEGGKVPDVGALKIESPKAETNGYGEIASILSSDSQIRSPGNVHVIALGFVSRMADYMVAADVLVSKAGPGTISEAAAVSLPVMLTSYLPGQEEGNVDFVIEKGFGSFCSDADPIAMAEELCMWLTDDEKLVLLSKNAKAAGTPYAARDIARQIGDSTLKWRELNDEKTFGEANMHAQAVASKD